jgi:hypothetical protein
MMSKTIGIVAFVAMALIAKTAVDADAHWTIVGGKLTYHASIDCEGVWKNVKNLSETNPAEGKCSLVGEVVEIECKSPTQKIVRGTASHPIVFPEVSGPIDQTIDEKTKGRGHLFVEAIEDDVTLGLTSDDVCNNLWTLTRALLRKSEMTLDIYVPDTNGILVSTAVFTCVLPAQYNFNNPPPVGPPGVGLSIGCDLESFTHHQ